MSSDQQIWCSVSLLIRRPFQVAQQAERQARALRQQHDKLKADLAARAAAGERRGAPRRVQDLEQQLDDVRSHYQKKVRALQMQLDANAAAPSQPASGNGDIAAFAERTNTPHEGGGDSGNVRSSQGLGKQWVALRQQLGELRRTVAAKDAEIERLQAACAPQRDSALLCVVLSLVSHAQ